MTAGLMRDPTGLYLLWEHGNPLFFDATWFTPLGERVGPADEEQVVWLLRAERLQKVGTPAEVFGFDSDYFATVYRVAGEADTPYIVEA